MLFDSCDFEMYFYYNFYIEVDTYFLHTRGHISSDKYLTKKCLQCLQCVTHTFYYIFGVLELC